MTALEVEVRYYPDSSRVGITSGKNFPDALSAIRLAYEQGMPLILSNGDVLQEQVEAYLHEQNIEYYYVFGGSAAIGEDLLIELK